MSRHSFPFHSALLCSAFINDSYFIDITLYILSEVSTTTLCCLPPFLLKIIFGVIYSSSSLPWRINTLSSQWFWDFHNVLLLVVYESELCRGLAFTSRHFYRLSLCPCLHVYVTVGGRLDPPLCGMVIIQMSALFLSSRRHLCTIAVLVSRRFSWDVNKTKHSTYWPHVERTPADQIKNSTQIQLDESLNLLGWLTGMWMTERHLYHQEVSLVTNMYPKSPTHPPCR